MSKLIGITANTLPLNWVNCKRAMKTSAAVLGFGSVIVANGCSTLATDAAQPTTTSMEKPVIALVLGGGGAKGYAHVGVIKALEANNISPNLVVGTSVGSFVGSLYANGKSAQQLESIALTTADSDLTDLTLSYQGIIEGQKLRDFVNQQVNNQPIQAFPTRFAAVAAEKHTLKKTVFTTGEAGLVVQASSSVPNVFIAPRIPDPKTSGQIGKKYVDGGVVSIVPVDSAKALGADVVIAVDLQVGKTTAASKGSSSRSIWTLLEQGYNSYINNRAGSTTANRADNKKAGAYSQDYQSINNAEIGRADIVIRPDVANISTISTVDREQAIAAGVKATEQQLPKIKQAIHQANLKYQANLK